MMQGPPPRFVRVAQGVAEGLIIGLIPKAGYTSMVASVPDRFPAPEVLREQMPFRIYIREPFARLVSCYRDMTRPNGHLDGIGFEDFVDLVLDSSPGDAHWAPQSRRFNGYQEPTMYQFERISETWPVDIELKHERRSPDHIAAPELGYRMDELRRYYEEDVRAWSECVEERPGGTTPPSQV